MTPPETKLALDYNENGLATLSVLTPYANVFMVKNSKKKRITHGINSTVYSILSIHCNDENSLMMHTTIIHLSPVRRSVTKTDFKMLTASQLAYHLITSFAESLH